MVGSTRSFASSVQSVFRGCVSVVEFFGLPVGAVLRASDWSWFGSCGGFGLLSGGSDGRRMITRLTRV